MNNDKQNVNQSEDEVENGFFTDDDNRLQTQKEHEEDASSKPKDEKVTPLQPSTEPTLGDKITINTDNEDMVTLVTDDNPDSYNNDDNGNDEAH